MPYAHGYKLHQSIPAGRAHMITIPGGEHVNLVEFEKFREEIERVLE